MQTSSGSSNNRSFSHSREGIPRGKRAQAIKWTEQEWADIAASIYLTDPTLLHETGLGNIKARHVFEAQQSCLSCSRQRQLISIAQDFSNKREKILATMLEMLKGKSRSGMTLRPAEGSCPIPATQAIDAPTSTAEPDQLSSQNSFVMLARCTSDTVTWSPEEWAAVARALLDDNVMVRDGLGEEGLNADSIYAAQQGLPEVRRRGLAAIQARLAGDAARLRNILDVLRTNMRRATPDVAQHLSGTIFRADKSGNGFIRFTPKALSEAYPGHRIVTAEDAKQLSGIKRKGPSFKFPFPAEVETTPVRRPEVEQAIAEVFGSPHDPVATPPATQDTMHAILQADEALSRKMTAPQKRILIRWQEPEWRQIAKHLIEQTGGNADPEKQGLITPLTVYAAQSCLKEERRRTIGSVYSGFSSTREKLAEIIKELAANPAASYAAVSSIQLLPEVATVAAPDVFARAYDSEAVSVPEAHYPEPIGQSGIAEVSSSHSLDSSLVFDNHLVEASQLADATKTVTEIARPFVRMMCEEFWHAFARLVLPPGAAYSKEKNDSVF